MRKLKTLQLFLGRLLMVVIIQGCGSNFESQSGQKVTSVDEETATIELSSASLEDDLILKVPQGFTSSSHHEQEFEWFFIDEDGNVVDLQTYTDQFDLTGLEYSFFVNGSFKVRMPENSAVQFIIFVIKSTNNPVEYPVAGLPPQPIGEVAGLPIPIGQSVVGVPPPIGQRVVGLPPYPIGQRVIGLPPMPTGLRVMGLPPLEEPAIGLRAVGLPAQPSQ